MNCATFGHSLTFFETEFFHLHDRNDRDDPACYGATEQPSEKQRSPLLSTELTSRLPCAAPHKAVGAQICFVERQLVHSAVLITAAQKSDSIITHVLCILFIYLSSWFISGY